MTLSCIQMVMRLARNPPNLKNISADLRQIIPGAEKNKPA